MVSFDNCDRKVIIFTFITFLCVLAASFSLFIMIKRNTIEYHSINNLFYSESIYYNNEYYSMKDDITTYLLMGIDNDGGQADTLILAVADNEKKELFLIPINRNIMADIKVFDNKSHSFNIEKRQICLAHSSVYNFYDPEIATAEAVSKLLFDLPIDYYISLDMDGIEHIGTIIGNVDVIVNETVFDSDLVEGETLTVNSKNIYEYLRTRNVLKIGGAQKRLERQVNFLVSCFNKFKRPVKTFNTITDTISSSNDFDEFKDKYKIMQSFVKTDVKDLVIDAIRYLEYEFSENNIYYVPHRTQLDENGVYETCYINVYKTKEILLKIFYKKTLF